MGFDVYGKRPISQEGEYFRNNVWYWRPLWKFVCESCNDFLTIKDFQKGESNSDLVIAKVKAEKIAKRLKYLLKIGAVKRYEEEYKKKVDNMPDVACNLCKGTGTRNDKYTLFKDTLCNTCKGTGKVKPFATYYPFEEDNVREFAKFCANSGGFSIS